MQKFKILYIALILIAFSCNSLKLLGGNYKLRFSNASKYNVVCDFIWGGKGKKYRIGEGQTEYIASKHAQFITVENNKNPKAVQCFICNEKGETLPKEGHKNWRYLTSDMEPKANYTVEYVIFDGNPARGGKIDLKAVIYKTSEFGETEIAPDIKKENILDLGGKKLKKQTHK